MTARSSQPYDPKRERRLRWFAGLCGGLVGLALLKFGTAVIMEGHIDWPRDAYEWVLLSQWPIVLGQGLAIALAVLGATVARWRPGRHGWLAWLPAAWLVWQCLAAAGTVDAPLTLVTLRHFAVCVACFYLGYAALGRLDSLGRFWLPVVVALFLMGLVGVEQRFGGMARTREFILQNEATHWRNCPPEQVAEMERTGMLLRTPEGYTAHPGLLQKAQSGRISATLFYPNALAGALLLLLPPALAAVLRTTFLTPAARGFVGAILGLGGLACLYWSGSKAGWLLALLLGVIALLRSPISRPIKTGVLVCLLVAGVVGFGVRYAAFFKRGATSVVARFDYWRAGWQTALSHPLLGTGPGTFFRAYERIKKPESEMTRLAHNDYLQQASDSGWPGFLLYTGFVAGVLLVGGRWVMGDGRWEGFTVWLGTLGWALQGLVEFGLYIPALAWTAFLFLGWLLAAADAEGEGLRRA